MNIIVDAMGGDNAPHAIVKGSLAALREMEGLTVTLTGDGNAIEGVLKEEGFAASSKLNIVHTTEIIEMCDTPVKAIKEKEDSSMVAALKLVKEMPNALMISAGNTGALVAGGTLIVKRIKGIKRPALAPVLPSMTGAVLLIDGGANVDCKPQYLGQFGLMGSVYMDKVLNVSEPKVALINNGAEAEKGSELTKEAYKLLSDSPINFVGNAEGRDLLSGNYDVLVCDGFTGNIVLKFLEGCAKTILGMLKGYIKESTSAKLGAVMMKGAFSKLKKKMDYSEYGGALLLGLNAGVMKAHGSSDELAIYHSVKAAEKFLKGNVTEVISGEIKELSEDE